MPNRHSTLTSLFEDIADAIRSKTGGSSTIIADDFDTAIDAIPTGGTSDNYFWIENLSASTQWIQIGCHGSRSDMIDVSLQYSTDKTTWNNITLIPNTSVNAAQIAPNQKIYFKNNKNYLSIPDGTVTFRISSQANCNIGGKLASLINNIDSEGIPPYSFQSIFSANQGLLDASALILPKYVNAHCYESMFANCVGLTAVPTLPALVLADSCYTTMFNNCTALTTAPTLPAIVLANSCYMNMFSGCTALTTAPTLSSTALAQACYMNMFSGCTALTTAPTLPATIVPQSCYEGMFNGCSALTTAPALPATSISNYYVYQNMFKNCTSLTAAPALPATTLSMGCYNSMFYGCTSLVTVPELPAKALQYGSYMSMFSGCSALKVYTTSDTGHDKAWTIPSDGTFTSNQVQNYMFAGVDTDSVPANFPGASGQQYTYYTQNTPVSAN